MQLYNEALTQLNLLKSHTIIENETGNENNADTCIRLLLSILNRPMAVKSTSGDNEASQRQTESESSVDLDRVEEAQLNQVASEFSSRFPFKATYD